MAILVTVLAWRGDETRPKPLPEACAGVGIVN